MVVTLQQGIREEVATGMHYNGDNQLTDFIGFNLNASAIHKHSQRFLRKTPVSARQLQHINIIYIDSNSWHTFSLAQDGVINYSDRPKAKKAYILPCRWCRLC